ncbi:leucine-rich repeat domain-containing protein [Vibrio scophthalmi]|uniref:leucine-rich repeat domain-containing protein n=1 Tax=Vibrio scophthalmi TaxID=45658 RepID=UPI003EBD7E2B
MLTGAILATLFGLAIIESSAQQTKFLPSLALKAATNTTTTKRELAVSQPHTLTLDDVSFDKKQGRIDVYKGKHKHIVIPDNFDGIPVTEIWDYAFSEVEDLSEEFEEVPQNPIASVVIPNTVTEIGEGAFQRNALTEIVIPSSVTRIGYKAFAENALTSVDIPDSVTEIAESAFAKNALTQLSLPNSLTKINERVFQFNALASITIPDSVTEIGLGAFRGNVLQSITIPDSVTDIDSEAFADNAITSVFIPTSVTYMGNGAFTDNPLRGRIIKGFGEKKPPRELTDEEWLEVFGDL